MNRLFGAAKKEEPQAPPPAKKEEEPPVPTLPKPATVPLSEQQARVLQ